MIRPLMFKDSSVKVIDEDHKDTIKLAVYHVFFMENGSHILWWIIESEHIEKS